MDLTGRLLRGRYRVVRTIGEGAMGDVYLVHHREHPGLRFAMKVLKPHWAEHKDFGERFRAEGKVLERLNHPGIVQVYDSFETEGALCMVMAFVEGESLAQRLRRQGPMTAAEAIPMFKAVLTALDHAHQAGVVHRDVKPSNILIAAEDGQPRLCDFGIAKQVGEAGRTQLGIALGTPSYMSPEQIRTPTEVDHRTDLYSAAIVLYEMLTGRVPFGTTPGRSDYAVLEEQISSDPPDPRQWAPDLDAQLVTVLMKALRKQPERRMQGGHEFILALDTVDLRAPARARSPQRPAERKTAELEPAATPEPVRPVGPARFAVYEHPTLGRETVKRGISWPALIGGPLWLLAKRLYARALVWWIAELLLVAMIVFLQMQTRSENIHPVLLGLGGIALLIWIMPGLRGNQWREESLTRRGWVAME